MDVKDRLRQIFYEEAGESFSYRQLIKKIGIRDAKTKEALKDILLSMEAQGKVARNRDGRFVSNSTPSVITGKVDHVNPRFAYVISVDSEEDIWIKSSNLNFAIDGDEV